MGRPAVTRTALVRGELTVWYGTVLTILRKNGTTELSHNAQRRTMVFPSKESKSSPPAADIYIYILPGE